MATTYIKIRATLAEMVGKKSCTPQQLKAHLANRDKVRKEAVFQGRRQGPGQRRPLSDDAFQRLFEFMQELGLITKDAKENLLLPATVQGQLEDEQRYKIFLSRRVSELLEQSDISIPDLRKATNSINYPRVRDPETILGVLKKENKAKNNNKGQTSESKLEQMKVPRFRQILFLLASAEQSAQRHMHISYDFNL
jgi:hypothetical protein